MNYEKVQGKNFFMFHSDVMIFNLFEYGLFFFLFWWKSTQATEYDIFLGTILHVFVVGLEMNFGGGPFSLSFMHTITTYLLVYVLIRYSQCCLSYFTRSF